MIIHSDGSKMLVNLDMANTIAQFGMNVRVNIGERTFNLDLNIREMAEFARNDEAVIEGMEVVE